MNQEKTNQKDLLKQYEILIDLYKFYFELIIKACSYYYLVTGGIVTYYFSEFEVAEKSGLKYAMVLPIALSIVLGMIFIIGARKNKSTKLEVTDIGRKLGFAAPPDLKILSIVLYPLSFVLIGTGIFLFFITFVININ